MARTDRLNVALQTGGLPLPETGDVLVMRASTPALAQAVNPVRLVFEQSFRPLHDMIAAAGLRVTPYANAPAAMAIVTLTRNRTENLGAIARALALLPPGGIFAMDGAKTDGVDSLARQVAAALPLAGQFAKAHGRVVWLVRPSVLPGEVEVWAEAAAPSRTADGFVTAPGLFSPEGPDPGSLRLAAHLAGRIKGRVADLGAGWGWLALQALARCPGITAIDLVEAEARALDAARRNVLDPRATFHWADARVLDRADPAHDAVITNPPFHQGRAAAPEIGAAFIAAAARLLKPSGVFLMVANRQLPYEAALETAFAQWEKLSEDGIYKVIAATRPRRSRERR
jgi:16S rRNA (guanine1207-N2)-methyltransferase